jgi:8-oxo-dGTP diphosphatase
VAQAPNVPDPVVGTDAAASRFMPVNGLLRRRARLAFDHDTILRDGVECSRAKLEYSALATALCPTEFTVGELRAVYKTVWGVKLDLRNFHRKITGTPGFLIPTGQTTRGADDRRSSEPAAAPRSELTNPCHCDGQAGPT